MDSSPFNPSIALTNREIPPQSILTKRSRLGHSNPGAKSQSPYDGPWVGADNPSHGPVGLRSEPLFTNKHTGHPPNLPQSPLDLLPWTDDFQSSNASLDIYAESPASLGFTNTPEAYGRVISQRRPSNRDEFDGPHQFLDKPSSEAMAAFEKDLPHLPTNLYVNEQDEILSQVNDRLSQCAFDFIAKYAFPIPLEPDKRPVRISADREWTEWVYLLKRLATKRRIPARVLYNGQIKQLVTVLENSLEMRHAAKHQSRPLKDDRNVLQLISAGLQVAKLSQFHT